MIEFLFDAERRMRVIAWTGLALVTFQWWAVPLLDEPSSAKWLWALDPSRYFPLWFRLVIPPAVLLVPWRKWLGGVFRRFLSEPSRARLILRLSLGGGVLFWVFRVGTLELGDAKLIMDYFVALTTYASVREPLESVLHTDFAALLFHAWGIHPQTSFQLLSCLWGALMLAVAGVGLAWWNGKDQNRLPLIGTLFLVAPIHLFFGYIEWYTQLALGLIVFEIFALRQLIEGKGLLVALAGLAFASASHLIGVGFLPAAVVLLFFVRKPETALRDTILLVTVFAIAIAFTLVWIERHIAFGHSARATANLFTTLLPLMREDSPNNPPGAWQYPWLSPNHLADLANQVLFCGLFPMLVLLGSAPGNRLYQRVKTALRVGEALARRDRESALILFFLPQILLGCVFLLVWNPWLGFPGDWDLFSFFAWPLLACALLAAHAWLDPESRSRLLWCAGVPAASLVFAWVIAYHRGTLPSIEDLRARASGSLAELRWEQAERAKLAGDWPTAFRRAEEALVEDPRRGKQALDLFDVETIQKMADEWPAKDHLTRMAVDFEIVSASPSQQLFVMDCWGRVFFWEGGYYNLWSPNGIPDIPRRHAVGMEIVPWRGAAVILADDGSLFEVPAPSWVDPEPSKPRLTHKLTPPTERPLSPIGNLFVDYAGKPMGPGARAVDLAVEPRNRMLVALDSSGNLTADLPHVDFEVKRPAPFSTRDAEVRLGGGLAFIMDWFGWVQAWPGEYPSIPVTLDFNWPAMADLEIGPGGEELYLLDVQGGLFPFTKGGPPSIDFTRLVHFSPQGQEEKYAPYVTEPMDFFHDLELVPGEKAFYRMNWNFRIHYSEQR
ncbi:MAG: hypothetical protein GHCLOJNM_01076 [bacterium]|nr:hypothetical protein [bacterium]